MDILKLLDEVTPPADYSHRNGFSDNSLIDSLNDVEKAQLEDALIQKIFEPKGETELLVVETLSYLKSEKSIPILEQLLQRSSDPMKKLIIALLCLVACPGFSQVQTLSDAAEISVITLGPDQDDLVQAFGHSAFRVVDPGQGIDYVFNYGVFSFNQPHFFLNFARGHNYYYLGVASYPDFIQVYMYYNRFVHEQVLNLTPAQKQNLFAHSHPLFA